MARSVARQAAMQLLYERMSGGDADEDTLNLAYEELGKTYEETAPSADDRAYIDDVLAGIPAHTQELDRLIEDHSNGDWALDRLARVDLSILRLAAYELCYRDDVPDNVAISEAMELANRYSEPKSGRYINGVLGAIARDKRKD